MVAEGLLVVARVAPSIGKAEWSDSAELVEVLPLSLAYVRWVDN